MLVHKKRHKVQCRLSLYLRLSVDHASAQPVAHSHIELSVLGLRYCPSDKLEEQYFLFRLYGTHTSYIPFISPTFFPLLFPVHPFLPFPYILPRFLPLASYLVALLSISLTFCLFICGCPIICQSTPHPPIIYQTDPLPFLFQLSLTFSLKRS